MAKSKGKDPKGRKSAGWKEGGIDAERKRLKEIAGRLAKIAGEAKSRKHFVHAGRMKHLAKLADNEYKRLTHVDKLSGDEFGAEAEDFAAVSDELASAAADLGEDVDLGGTSVGRFVFNTTLWITGAWLVVKVIKASMGRK